MVKHLEEALLAIRKENPHGFGERTDKFDALTMMLVLVLALARELENGK